jgi:hypothetical protein
MTHPDREAALEAYAVQVAEGRSEWKPCGLDPVFVGHGIALEVGVFRGNVWMLIAGQPPGQRPGDRPMLAVALTSELAIELGTRLMSAAYRNRW